MKFKYSVCKRLKFVKWQQHRKKESQVFDPKAVLKVSKSLKQILKFSSEPKNEQEYFCISAIASKSGQIKKM